MGRVGSSTTAGVDAGSHLAARDLFPLPLLAETAPDTSGLSPTVAQRLRRRYRRAVAADEVFDSLNEIYGGGSPAVRCSAGQREAQREVLRNMAAAPEADMVYASRNAARELLRSSLSYDKEEAPSAVASYVRSLVSIPEVGATPPQLRDVLDPHGIEVLDRFEDSMLVSADEWGQRCEKGDFGEPYMDPLLKSDQALTRCLSKICM